MNCFWLLIVEFAARQGDSRGFFRMDGKELGLSGGLQVAPTPKQEPVLSQQARHAHILPGMNSGFLFSFFGWLNSD